MCLCTGVLGVTLDIRTLDSASLYLAMSLRSERTSTIANMPDKKIVMMTELTRENHWMLDGGPVLKT